MKNKRSYHSHLLFPDATLIRHISELTFFILSHISENHSSLFSLLTLSAALEKVAETLRRQDEEAAAALKAEQDAAAKAKADALKAEQDAAAKAKEDALKAEQDALAAAEAKLAAANAAEAERKLKAEQEAKVCVRVCETDAVAIMAAKNNCEYFKHRAFSPLHTQPFIRVKYQRHLCFELCSKQKF